MRRIKIIVRSRAIAHAEYLASTTNSVVTVLFQDHGIFSTYDFGMAYIDSRGAIYNALPPRYFTSDMARYRAEMHTYRLPTTGA